MSQLELLIQQVIERWRRENIPIRPGVDLTKINELESRLGAVLPSDMREFYLTIDGMGDHFDEEHFFRFWPIEQIQSVNQYYSDVAQLNSDASEYYYFFDHSIGIFLYAIRLGNSSSSCGPVAFVSSPYDPTFQPFCGTFSEFLSIYVLDPDCLLSGIR
jgi:hypothetical protein